MPAFLFHCMPPYIAPQIRLHGLGGDSDRSLANSDGFQIAALGELADGLLRYRQKFRGLSDSDIVHG